MTNDDLFELMSNNPRRPSLHTSHSHLKTSPCILDISNVQYYSNNTYNTYHIIIVKNTLNIAPLITWSIFALYTVINCNYIHRNLKE